MNQFTNIYRVVLLGAMFLTIKVSAEPAEWAVFGLGVDKELNSSCFIINYPSSFLIHESSGVALGDRNRNLMIRNHKKDTKEDNLHTLVLEDPTGSLEVRACKYSFLSKEHYVSRGFVSPREVVLVDFFRNAMLMKIEKRKHFEIIRSQTDAEIVVIYLSLEPQWGGGSFQTLSFKFSKSKNYNDFKEDIEKIVDGFVPGFVRD